MGEQFEGMAGIAQEEAQRRLLRVVDGGSDADKEAAWNEIYRQHRDRLVSIARGIVTRPEVAEEVAQDALARAAERFDEFDRSGSFAAWLTVITKNLALDKVRRKDYKNTSSYDALQEKGFDPADSRRMSPEAALRQKEMNAEVREALEKLNERYRQAIELRDLQEKTREEAAAEMGVTVGNFDVMHFRAKQALKKVLGRSEEIDLAA